MAVESKNLSWLKRLIIGVVSAGALFVLVTAPYWKTQVNYLLQKNAVDKSDTADTKIPETQQKTAPDRIIIERLKIEAPIIYVAEENEEVLQKALQDGAVHYPRTAEVGQRGNAYIFGHSSDYIWSSGNYKNVFELLPKINIGDEITVTDHDGRKFAYRVFETKVVKPSEVGVLNDQLTPRKLLTLQTSYPLGTALRRFIVVAELIEK